jgi:hypothetical protein
VAENEENVVVERIDFKSFPKPLKNGALGLFFGKVTHGMTVNFFFRHLLPISFERQRPASLFRALSDCSHQVQYVVRGDGCAPFLIRTPFCNNASPKYG